MCTKKINYKVFLLLFVFFMVAKVTIAENDFISSSSEKQQTTNISRHPDVQKAINVFARALEIDLKHKTSKENLAEVLAHPGLTAKQRSDALRLEDYLKYMENLQGRANYLISKCGLLKNQLIEKGYDQGMMDKKLLNFKEDISGARSSYSKRRVSLVEDSLAAINNLLAQEKEQLIARVEYLQKQYHWLKAASQDRPYTPARPFVRTSQIPEGPYFSHNIAGEEQREYSVMSLIGAETGEQPEIGSLETEFYHTPNDKGGTLAEVVAFSEKAMDEKSAWENSRERFKKELGFLYVQLDALEQKIWNKDGKIDSLSKQVVDISLRLSETEASLNKNISKASGLQTELDDAQQRVALGQRIIKEKDEEIHSLDQARLEANKQKEELSKILDSKSKEKEKLAYVIERKNQELKSFEDKLVQATKQRMALEKDIASKNDELNNLAGLLSKANKQKRQFEAEIMAKNQEIGNLETSLEKANKLKEEFDKIVNSKEHKINDLASALREMTEKKDELKDMVAAKSRQLAKLEASLTGFERRKGEVETTINSKSKELSSVKASAAKTNQQKEKLDKIISSQNQKLAKLDAALSKISKQKKELTNIIASKDRKLSELEKALSKKNIQSDKTKDQKLAKLESSLAEAKRKTEELNRIIALKDGQLAKLEGSLLADRHDLVKSGNHIKEKTAYTRSLEKELADLQARYQASQMAVQEKSNEMATLQTGAGDVRLKEEGVSAEAGFDGEKKEQKLKELNGILNIYKQSLSEADRAIREKGAKLHATHDELTKLQKRYYLKVTDFEQKDYQVRILKGALVNEKAKRDDRSVGLRRVVMERDQTIDKLQAKLSQTQENLEMANQIIESKMVYLNYLKEELAALRSQVPTGEKMVQSEGESLTPDVVEGASTGLSEENAWEEQLNHIIEARDEKLIELNGMLNIYKDKLVEEKQNIVEKTASINSLEQQVTKMHSALQEKNAALVKTKNDLIALEDQLTAVKSELLKLKENPGTHNPQDKSAVETEVHESQSRLQDAQKFLLENLHDSDTMNARLISQ